MKNYPDEIHQQFINMLDVNEALMNEGIKAIENGEEPTQEQIDATWFLHWLKKNMGRCKQRRQRNKSSIKTILMPPAG